MNGDTAVDEELPPFVQQHEELPPFVMQQQEELPPFVAQQEPPPPEAEGQLATFTRRAINAAPATVAGLGAGAYAAPIFSAAGSALGRVVGGAAGTFGGPAGTVAGWLAGGALGGYLGEKAYSAGKELLGIDDAQQMAVNAKAHPWTSAAGEVAPTLLGLRPGANVIEGATSAAGRFLASPTGQRVTSGVASGAVEGGMQAARGEWEPERLVANVAAGVALPGTRGWLTSLGRRGEDLAGRTVPHGTPGSKGAAGTAEEQPQPSAAPTGDSQNQPTPAGVHYGKTDWESGRYPARPEGEQTFGTPLREQHEDPAVAQAMRREPIQEPGVAAEARTPEPIVEGAPEAGPTGPARAPGETMGAEAPVAEPLAPEPAPRPAIEPVPRAAEPPVAEPPRAAEPPVETAPRPAAEPGAPTTAPERGPLAREVAPHHMPWYDEGYAGRPQGGNQAEQAAWDRGAQDRMNAERAARGDVVAPIDRPEAKAGPSWLDTLKGKQQAAPAKPGKKDILGSEQRPVTGTDPEIVAQLKATAGNRDTFDPFLQSIKDLPVVRLKAIAENFLGRRVLEKTKDAIVAAMKIRQRQDERYAATSKVQSRILTRQSDLEVTPPTRGGIRDVDVQPMRATSRSTLRETLNQYGSSQDLGPRLTSFIRNKVRENAGDTPVYIVPHSELEANGMWNQHGYYDLSNDHIVLSDRLLKDRVLMSQIALHEGLHAATAHAIEANPRLRDAAIELIMDFNRVGRFSDYGLSHPHEFLAEAFTNPHFQTLLREHNLSPEAAKSWSDKLGSFVRTAWDAVVNFVRNALGVPKGMTNALEAALRTTEAAMELNPAAKLRAETDARIAELSATTARDKGKGGTSPEDIVHSRIAKTPPPPRYRLAGGAGGPPPPVPPVGGAAAADVNMPGAAPSTPSSLGERVRAAADKLFSFGAGIGRDIQMKVAPMATGDRDSMAAAKDFANIRRRIDYDRELVDSKIEKQFTPEQRKRMWDAADEESVMRQRGETSEHMGIATLTPAERALTDSFQPKAQAGWARMRELGMVTGEGLPYWTPRMLAHAMETGEGGPRTLDRMGANLRITTPQTKHRKYEFAEETEAAMKKHFGEEAGIARDIRVMPLAIAKMEHAIAGREFVNEIRELAKAAGLPDAVGNKPGPGWFTIDHPAMYETHVRPRMEEADTATYRGKVEEHGVVKVPPSEIPLFDRNGNPVLNYERVPIWLPDQMEGPLRAVLTKPSGLTYAAAMELKGKTMGLIMNSPLIHNAVEWGRALPAMPGKVATFKVYFEGNRAKNDPAIMREAIDGGLVPIGKRFFNQDITSIMEQPNLTPGRSWTSQVLGFVPGLFDPKAGVAVKRAIDRAGDFWHNTLLWDRIGDLQMGLYTNLRDDLLKKGVDRQSATRAAAHWANRYAGALPQEAMSDAARKFANLLLFSRSFTLGNLGAMKDMVNGLPRDVRAQISRDIGSLDPKAEGYIKSLAMRKAVSIVMLDMGLMYAGNSLLQSGLNVMRGDSTLDEEGRGYADRLSGLMKRVREHPLSLLQPFSNLESVSATGENEPGRQDRVHVGYTKDGTAIYARNPAGKIGEEFAGYLTGPLDMLRRKLGTVTRPVWQILANDKGFGRKVYDPNADTPAKYLNNMGKIVAHFFAAQTPEGQIRAAADLIKGEGDPKLNALQAFGPIAGVTFSRGAPGGPAQGELYRAREKHNYAVNEAMPEIRRMIQRGDVETARQQMRDLGIPPGLQRFYIRTTQNPALRLTPRAVQDFNRYATPEERERFTRQRQRQVPLTPDLIQ